MATPDGTEPDSEQEQTGKSRNKNIIVTNSLLSSLLFIVVLSLRAAGNAPQLKHKKFAVEKDRTISWVIQWLHQKLKCEENESLVSCMIQIYGLD